jgi:hypothetical protein
LDAVSHAQFVVQALEVGVHGVRRDAEIDSDGEFGLAIEYAPHDFSFRWKAQAADNSFQVWSEKTAEPGLPRTCSRPGRAGLKTRALASAGRPEPARVMIHIVS